MDWTKIQIELQQVFDAIESGAVQNLTGADMVAFLTICDLAEAIYDATSHGMVSGEA